MPLLLLVVFSLAFIAGLVAILMVLRRPQAKLLGELPSPQEEPIHSGLFSTRPSSWLAIKARNIQNVQAALHLHNPRPCALAEGLSGDINLFIAPPFGHWILVTGSGLPNPADDVDECFNFLAVLSRRLGEVQYFYASAALQHHAWVRMNRGKVLRAFAWAGETLWTQGKLTAAEASAGVVCPGYGDCINAFSPPGQDVPAANVEKVPYLAARWSLDPGNLELVANLQQQGIAGEWSLSA